MARTKSSVAAHARHKEILKQAKGYRGARGSTFRAARQAVIRAGEYAYRDRRTRKRFFRSLWIVRINAGARRFGLSYSRMIAGMSRAGIEIDRKILAELAVSDMDAFGKIAEKAKAALTA